MLRNSSGDTASGPGGGSPSLSIELTKCDRDSYSPSHRSSDTRKRLLQPRILRVAEVGNDGRDTSGAEWPAAISTRTRVDGSGP